MYIISPCFKGENQHIQKKAVEVFGRYQKSNMGTVKWHLLNHIVDDMLRLGSMIVCDAGIYEQSHRLFKFIYETTNKRLSTAIHDTISTLGGKLQENVNLVSKKRKIHSTTNEKATENMILESKNLPGVLDHILPRGCYY